MVSNIWDAVTALTMFGEDYHEIVFADAKGTMEPIIDQVMKNLAMELEIDLLTPKDGVFIFDDIVVEYFPGPFISDDLDLVFPDVEKWNSKDGVDARDDMERIRTVFHL